MIQALIGGKYLIYAILILVVLFWGDPDLHDKLLVLVESWSK